jgi:uncharacterized protein (DUF4415 family)
MVKRLPQLMQWISTRGGHWYQTRINAILREAMLRSLHPKG